MRYARKGPLCNLRITQVHSRRLIWTFIVCLQNQWILLYMSTNKEYPDQTARVRTLNWTFAVRIIFPHIGHHVINLFLLQLFFIWLFWFHWSDITKTYLYSFDSLKPHFYIVKLEFTGVYIIFSSPEPKAQGEVLWSLTVRRRRRRPSVRPSVHNL